MPSIGTPSFGSSVRRSDASSASGAETRTSAARVRRIRFSIGSVHRLADEQVLYDLEPVGEVQSVVAQPPGNGTLRAEEALQAVDHGIHGEYRLCARPLIATQQLPVAGVAHRLPRAQYPCQSADVLAPHVEAPP